MDRIKKNINTDEPKQEINMNSEKTKEETTKKQKKGRLRLRR